MPTLLLAEGFRFFFFSNEGFEPPHVHVEKGDGHAKFWLSPLELAESYALGAKELKRAREIVAMRRSDFPEKWHEHFRT